MKKGYSPIWGSKGIDPPIKGGWKWNSVVPVSVGATGRSDLLGSVALIPKSTAFGSRGCKSTVDPVLVFVVADPADLGVVLDNGVSGVDKDNLIPLALSVCTDPIGVEDLEVFVSLLGPFLSHSLEGFTDDKLFLSLPLGTPTVVDVPLLEGSLPDLGPYEDISLFGLVSEGPGPVEPGGFVDAEEILLSSPLDPSFNVQSLHISVGGVVPGFSNVPVHAFSLGVCCSIFFCHLNHLFRIHSDEYISDGNLSRADCNIVMI